METNFNNLEYIKREIDIIYSKSINDNIVSYPIYINDNTKTINFKPIFGLRASQIGFELDSLHIDKTLTWISPGVSLEVYKPFINPIFPIIIYGWSNFYKHSMYGMEDPTSNSKGYFQFNPDYYIGYSSESQWDNFLEEGIDFDENIYGLLVQTNLVEFKLGNYAPRFGPFLSSNLFLSGQYPAFSNFHLKFFFKDLKYFEKVDYHLLCGDLEASGLLMDPYIINVDNIGVDINEDGEYNYLDLREDNPDSFLQPRTIYYHRIDFYIKKNFRLSFFESIISGHNRLDLSYLNPLSFYWSSQHAKSDKDNLLMGFDWEYIFSKSRVYGAFIMDEWSPTETFSPDNHNWFGYQFGATRVLTIKDIISSIKIEYASTNSNLYSHDIDRNLPQHHNYNLGFWNGGSSESWDIYLHTILSKKWLSYFHYSNHTKGITGYNIPNEVSSIWTKIKYKFGLEYSIIPNKLDINISYNMVLLEKLLESEEINGINDGERSGIEISFKYNVDY